MNKEVRPSRSGTNQTFEVSETSKVSRHQPYPAYKPSDVAWLGDMPAHWEVKRLKDAVCLNPETLPETTDPDFVLQYVDIGNVEEVTGVNPPQEMRFENAPSRARRVVRAGDTILSTVRTYLKAIAYFENPSGNLIVSTGFAALRPKQEISPKFLHGLVRSKEFIETVVAHSVGVGYPAINPSELACLPVWIPPLPEQRAIAAYLDRETARLDTLIAKNERLIQLLQEKRTALISHAVTKGLDSQRKNLPLKRWVAVKITDGPHETPEWVTDGIPFISAEAIKNSAIDFSAARGFIDEKTHHRFCQKAKAIRGDVLFCKAGATTGKLAAVDVDFEFSVWSPLAILRPHPAKILSRYLFYAMHAPAFQEQVRQRWSMGTQPNIGMDVLENLYVIAPDLQTQQAIVYSLDRETAKIDTLVAKVRQVIETLKEYRTALISAAVTGKMDVR